MLDDVVHLMSSAHLPGLFNAVGCTGGVCVLFFLRVDMEWQLL